jgi:phosphoribosylanthranilate isomerase (EC 5.3.1.24)
MLAEKLGADFIGVVTDTVSPRYVKNEFVRIVKRYVTKPVVTVKVKGELGKILEEGKEADFVQIHRVLTDEELQYLNSFKWNIILYVPASGKFETYFRKVISSSNYMVLLDKDNENKVDLYIAKKWISEYSKVGIGGGIKPENVRDYLSLNPYWIDISSGIELYKGKKDPSKMSLIIKEVREWTSIR